MAERILEQGMQTLVKPPLVDDSDLLDEVDEIILRRLSELEEQGTEPSQMKRWVSYYGRVYDLLYAKLLGRTVENSAGSSFSEEVYEFLAECYWAKIEGIYDPDLNISEEQAREVIGKTRAKLKRVETALFGH